MNHLNRVRILGFSLAMAGAHCAFATVAKCEPDSCRDDAEIAMNVQASLDRHPELGPPKSISARSINHVVYLHGLVDTGLQKRTAESLASQSPNVDRVVNSIEENN